MMETFAERLRRLREARRLKQRELAQRAEMDSAQISRYERGVIREPSADVLARLARALDVNVDLLRNGERRSPALAPLRAAVHDAQTAGVLPAFVLGAVRLADQLIRAPRS